MRNRINHMLFNLLFLCFYHLNKCSFSNWLSTRDGSESERTVLSLDRTSRPFARPCIRTGTLAPERQSAPVANSAVAAEVHQPLDVHRRFAPQITFNREIGDGGPELRHFGFCQVLHRRVGCNARCRANLFADESPIP